MLVYLNNQVLLAGRKVFKIMSGILLEKRRSKLAASHSLGLYLFGF
jgi:hypothetical protein